MTQYIYEAWEASELLIEWDGKDHNDESIKFKLLETLRCAWDGENSNETNSHWLIGIDNTGVRRIDLILDTAYDREIEDHYGIIKMIINTKSTPYKAIEILKRYAN